jgi:hypothetical protein
VPRTSATQAVPKAGVLMISTGCRDRRVRSRHWHQGEQVMVSTAPSPASVAVHKAAGRLQPMSKSNDGHVAACTTLGAPSVVSSSSSSLSGSSSSESIPASPPPIPDFLISSEFLDIPEIEAVQQTMEPDETLTRIGTSAGIFS